MALRRLGNSQPCGRQRQKQYNAGEMESKVFMLFRTIYRQVQLLRFWSWSRFLPVKMFVFPLQLDLSWERWGVGLCDKTQILIVMIVSDCANEGGLNCQLGNFVRGRAINPRRTGGILTVRNTAEEPVHLRRKGTEKLPLNGPLKSPANK